MKKEHSEKWTDERLAFSIHETAGLLGLSYQSVYRLILRGELKAVTKLRHKIIPRSEIDRFLASAS
jgi:excisionase family DNA binding protein